MEKRSHTLTQALSTYNVYSLVYDGKIDIFTKVMFGIGCDMLLHGIVVKWSVAAFLYHPFWMYVYCIHMMVGIRSHTQHNRNEMTLQ